MACIAAPGDGAFASSLIAFADCQARTIGAQGYAALAASGSSVSQLITVMLTILIALLGYRLLLGGTPTLREGVLSLVKIGVVLALATGWPAYQVLVYDVAINAPGELGATISGAAQLPGGAGDLAARLDRVDGQFEVLAIDNASLPSSPSPTGSSPPPIFVGFDTFALGAARVVFLVGAIGSYVATRLIAGLLLALGPLFLAFLLFDATRGLVEGWVKALSGAALGTLATSVILGAEIALLEPWLIRLIAIRNADTAIPEAAAQLLAATMLFATTLLAGLFAAVRLTASPRLPSGFASSLLPIPAAATVPSASRTSISREGMVMASITRSRAQMIADGVSHQERRESLSAMRLDPSVATSAATSRATGSFATPRANEVVGRGMVDPSSRRRLATRATASAKLRDSSL